MPIAAATFGLIAYLIGNAKFASYLQIHYVAGTGELAVICGALIGAGSTITKDVPAGALATSRVPQNTIEGAGTRYRERKLAEKAKRG